MNLRNLRNVIAANIEHGWEYHVGYIRDLAIHEWNYCHTSFLFSEQTFLFFWNSKFWLQILNGMGRFSGSRYCQKLPNYNRGAEGHFAPRPVASKFGELFNQYGQNLCKTQSTIKYGDPGRTTPTVFEFLRKKRNFTKNDQNAKKHKIVGMTSYSQ